MSALSNLEKYELAIIERQNRPADQRLAWHGRKGNIARWFPEYAQKFPEKIRQNPHKDKALPNVLPEWREDFCNFLDARRREWSAQNLCAQSIVEEPYRDPGTPLPEPDGDRHQVILSRLHSFKIAGSILRKWLAANPDMRSPSGKRAKTGMTHHFDRYALWIIARLEASVSAEFREAQRQADAFRTTVEARRAAEAERRLLLKNANTRLNQSNCVLGQARKKAVAIKRRLLSLWTAKYGHLFHEKPADKRSRQKRRLKRRAIYEAGEKMDPRVRDKVVQISIGPTVCHWCAKKLPLGGTVDHVVPVTKGGQHIRRNIVPACWPCNRDKKDAMPDSAGMPAGVNLELALI